MHSLAYFCWDHWQRNSFTRWLLDVELDLKAEWCVAAMKFCEEYLTDNYQNSRTLRRLAADQGALHRSPLPPNYLFPTGSSEANDLTQLDILLAGPTYTPFAAGVWKLHLTIPPNYPQQPPKANFRTSIFHPNVDSQTGGVCVETLKRDWDDKLTLKDVLVTISCLLIQPNPDSALNAEAGALIQENYGAFARRAELMTSIHATIPKALRVAVTEAQNRGQEPPTEAEDDRNEDVAQPAAPTRKKKPTARQRGTTSRRSNGSPSGGPTRRRQQPDSSHPFVVQAGIDDVFDMSLPPRQQQTKLTEDDDSSIVDVNQENDESKSPVKSRTPKATTPKRPHGAPVPLGELSMEDAMSDSDDDDVEVEYPPSPRKSPSKSPAKRRQQQSSSTETERPESSREALRRAPNITPPNNLSIKPLAADSPFVMATDPITSPRKARLRLETPGSGCAPLFPSIATPQHYGGIFKTKSPSPSEKKREAAKRKAEMDSKLWELCGRDIKRWNRGDFDGKPFKTKAKRW